MKLKKNELKEEMFVCGFTIYGNLLYEGTVGQIEQNRYRTVAQIRTKFLSSRGQDIMAYDNIKGIVTIQTKASGLWGAEFSLGYLTKKEVTNWKKFVEDD